MKTLQPSYYDGFECVADKCKDNCCVGWQVAIDKISYLKYREVKGEFGDILNSNINRNENSENDEAYGEIVVDDKMKCPLLNEDNLCTLYINKGADYLCHVCTIYPRNITLYGDIAEKNLTLSCPSVAKILVEKTEKINFIMNDDINWNKNECIMNISEQYKEFYDLVWEGRSLSIDMAQFSEIPMWKRLIFIKLMADKIQKRIDDGETSGVNEFVETLRNEITNESVIKSLDDVGKPSSNFKLNLILIIFKVRKRCGVVNRKFSNIAWDINELIENNSSDFRNLLDYKQTEFNEYFKDKEYILENYIVYNLYTVYMNCLITKELNKEIFKLMISYFIIKIFLLAMWEKNDKKITDEQIIDILYSLSREVEHNEIFIQSLHEEMNESGVNNIGYFTTMIY